MPTIRLDGKPTRTSGRIGILQCSGLLAQLVCYSLKRSYPGVGPRKWDLFPE